MDLKNRKEVFEKEDYLDAETGYPERDINWFTNYILPDFLSLNFINKDKSLLDVGCAHGYFTKVMCNNFKHTLGIDFAENRINYAKQFETDNLKFMWADLTADDFATKFDKKYDVLYTSAVIQHIDKKLIPKALDNLAKISADDAKFVMYDELAPRPDLGLWDRGDGFVCRFTIDWLLNNLTTWKLVSHKYVHEDIVRLVLEKL
jgi:cyclopropane fatty-acyl-phospholipid synthase-like methyltransferase